MVPARHRHCSSLFSDPAELPMYKKTVTIKQTYFYLGPKMVGKRKTKQLCVPYQNNVALNGSYNLSPSNLGLGDGSYPNNSHVHRDVHDTTDPDGSSIVSAIVAEDNGKHYATQIACCANKARKDAYRFKLMKRIFRRSLQKWYWRTYH
jgi:hypothetical protein